jgi:hypothetical protein
MIPLNAADFERAITWNSVIAAILIGDEFRDEGGERRWSGHGGFSIDRATGAWYVFAAAVGGFSSLGMIRHLRSAYGDDDARAWLAAFLATPEHQGFGPLEADTGAWTETRRLANSSWGGITSTSRSRCPKTAEALSISLDAVCRRPIRLS